MPAWHSEGNIGHGLDAGHLALQDRAEVFGSLSPDCAAQAAEGGHPRSPRPPRPFAPRPPDGHRLSPRARPRPPRGARSPPVPGPVPGCPGRSRRVGERGLSDETGTLSSAAASSTLAASGATSPVLAASGPPTPMTVRAEAVRPGASRRIGGRPSSGQGRLLGPALVRGPGAPGREPAALRRMCQVGWQAGDACSAFLDVLIELRNRCEQGLGVRMVHVVKESGRLGGLHHPARRTSR